MNPSKSEKPRSPIEDYLSQLHQEASAIRDGAVATYIPQLAKADPNWFGICIVTAGGNVYEVGDSRQPFTIQSISKPFVYGMALEDNTRQEVLAKVGMEPTGDAFNAISLEPGTGRPRNPMINAGAIATAGMIAGKSHASRFRRILHSFSLYAGRDLTIDEPVYQSEAETGHRNRAIGHMLRNFDILTEPPEPVVDLYFKQCSVSVTCRDLGVMAATLANHGVNPITKKQAIRGEYVESVLSVMAACGMYDYAGEWLYRIGMPAKSGVAGGVIAVLPGQLGIGVYSPALDARGNSVRGIHVCNALSRFLDLHLFNSPHTSESVIRLRFYGSEVNSSRKRNPAETQRLRDSGHAIRIYQLQGNVVFSTCEVVVSEVLGSADGLDYLVLDFQHVQTVDESACRLFHQLTARLDSLGKKVVFARANRLSALRRYMKAQFGDQFDSAYRAFDDNDLAMEWCENQWLGKHLESRTELPSAECDAYELFQGLSRDEVQIVSAVLKNRRFQKDEVIVEMGAPAEEVFFIKRGSVVIRLKMASGAQKRLGAFSAGMAFGEVGMLDGSPRTAMVVAETEVECDILTRAAFDALGESHPRIKMTILKNMALGVSKLLRKATREISVFEY